MLCSSTKSDSDPTSKVDQVQERWQFSPPALETLLGNLGRKQLAWPSDADAGLLPTDQRRPATTPESQQIHLLALANPHSSLAAFPSSLLLTCMSALRSSDAAHAVQQTPPAPAPGPTPPQIAHLLRRRFVRAPPQSADRGAVCDLKDRAKGSPKIKILGPWSRTQPQILGRPDQEL